MSTEIIISHERTPKFIEREILVVPLTDFDIKVAVAHSHEDVKRLRLRFDAIGSPNGFEPNPMPDGKVILLSGKEVKKFTFDKPYRTESGTQTDAIYLYRYEREGIEFLIQYLGPKRNDNQHRPYLTSFHGEHGVEFFGVLSGELFVSDGDRTRKLSKGNFEVIPENELHICYTLGDPVVTAILKIGDLSHKWYPKPDISDLINQARLLD